MTREFSHPILGARVSRRVTLGLLAMPSVFATACLPPEQSVQDKFRERSESFRSIIWSKVQHHKISWSEKEIFLWQNAVNNPPQDRFPINEEAKPLTRKAIDKIRRTYFAMGQSENTWFRNAAANIKFALESKGADLAFLNDSDKSNPKNLVLYLEENKGKSIQFTV